MTTRQFVLTRTNNPGLRFRGVLIAEASSSPDRAHPRFSGQTGIWHELSLYQMTDGRFVAHKQEHSLWVGARSVQIGAVCADESEVYAFFGYDWLAMALYDEADIDCTVDV
jgi:hypothetical protein